MRRVENPQMQLGQLPIDQIKFDPKSRDDIPVLLAGLKHIYTTPDLRDRVFEILTQLLPNKRPRQTRVDSTVSDDAECLLPNHSDTPGNPTKADPNNGRPGMDQWRILVLGTLRLGLNTNYDRVHELANQHRTVRQMLGHDDWHGEHPYEYTLNTIKDNVQLFTPEILDQINQEVVGAGHRLLKKKVRRRS